eukprot:5715287-Amphidinium_carterae.2
MAQSLGTRRSWGTVCTSTTGCTIALTIASIWQYTPNGMHNHNSRQPTMKKPTNIPWCGAQTWPMCWHNLTTLGTFTIQPTTDVLRAFQWSSIHSAMAKYFDQLQCVLFLAGQWRHDMAH